jgi:hypothetical protein
MSPRIEEDEIEEDEIAMTKQIDSNEQNCPNLVFKD